MVRLKIAYWEFDFEAVCPTLDRDLLSQAHIHMESTLRQTPLKVKFSSVQSDLNIPTVLFPCKLSFRE